MVLRCQVVLVDVRSGHPPRGFPRIFGYDLQAIKYPILVALDRGGFGGSNAGRCRPMLATGNPLLYRSLRCHASVVISLFQT